MTYTTKGLREKDKKKRQKNTAIIREDRWRTNPGQISLARTIKYSLHLSHGKRNKTNKPTKKKTNFS